MEIGIAGSDDGFLAAAAEVYAGRFIVCVKNVSFCAMNSSAVVYDRAPSCRRDATYLSRGLPLRRGDLMIY